MTREEAFECLKKGDKIQHNYFMEDEFLQYVDGSILTEESYPFDVMFWEKDFFAENWELFTF